MCRLRAVTAAVTYVTQPISWKPRKSSGVLGYAARTGESRSRHSSLVRRVVPVVAPPAIAMWTKKKGIHY